MEYLIRETSPNRIYYYIVRNSSSSRVFKAAVSLNEIYDIILKNVNVEYKRTKKTIRTENERLFKIMIIYGGVRQTIRKVYATRINKLGKIIIGMDEFSLQFWYTEFLSRYSRRNNIIDTFRVSKSFRDLYE
ncbi:hypothetical protein [Sulfurisphaera ohwakuensis]|uniref:Uncharacterized protein n=1 Tax=Sulfurisphaera ohwakuensis TaxID=69656 RepID=A0A650CFR3_SULOH|nr:hypothetical protein [Sulfurisphaera ohwakuensis]MBB5254120.1 hypothetical protein [Sulfurisphaera ohwakuensis]QGR16505.1 hypothetical protein D1869_04300 [Sulfurisphaera ohwakuensis]